MFFENFFWTKTSVALLVSFKAVEKITEEPLKRA